VFIRVCRETPWLYVWLFIITLSCTPPSHHLSSFFLPLSSLTLFYYMVATKNYFLSQKLLSFVRSVKKLYSSRRL
jgi:hypothetical protein